MNEIVVPNVPDGSATSGTLRSGKALRTVWEAEQPTLRPNTRYVGHALMTHLADFFGHEPSTSDFTTDSYRRFAAHLLRHVSLGSAKTYLQRLRALLNSAARCGIPPREPMPPQRVLLPRNPSPDRVFLTSREIFSLERTPCPHILTKQAFLFSCLTGLRLSDIETLRWGDIRTVNGFSIIVKAQVKTGKPVRIPLGDEALNILSTRPRADASTRIFPLLSRATVISDLNRWAADAGLDKHLTFHVARHSFATTALLAGVDIYTVSKLCGHTSVKTTEIYAHMIDETLVNGISKMTALFRSIRHDNSLREL